MHRTLRIATFNIHKGVTAFNARLVLRQQRELIRHMQADIVFLQEVRGEHARHRRLFSGAQHEYLADEVWRDTAYGKNAAYPAGHHGNAILSKYPIARWENVDISASSIEQRGLLHCEISVPGWEQDLHCICVHLGLFARWRRKQFVSLHKRIEEMVPPQAPLIIAGDFNDWRMKAGSSLTERLHLHEAFEHAGGKPARSFPSLLPLFRLDRIYTRGFRIQQVEVHSGTAYAKVSDHAALSATMTRL